MNNEQILREALEAISNLLLSNDQNYYDGFWGFKEIADKALAATASDSDSIDAVQIADSVRLRLAQEYQRRVDNETSQMRGNMDWARLEGAVKVVQALRIAATKKEAP